MWPHPRIEIISWRTHGLIFVAVFWLCWCSACTQIGCFGLVTLPSNCTSFPSSVLASTHVLTNMCKRLCLYQQWRLQRSNATGVVSCNLLILELTEFILERTTQWRSVKVQYKPCSSTTLSRWTVIHGFYVSAAWLPRSDEWFNRSCLFFAYLH